ncbi:MAG: hypothetical protein RML35_09825 [Chloroherpetonaceae bacterium]|nr:hypothetical protein [Chloroherpetonaceae bacterium]
MTESFITGAWYRAVLPKRVLGYSVDTHLHRNEWRQVTLGLERSPTMWAQLTLERILTMALSTSADKQAQIQITFDEGPLTISVHRLQMRLAVITGDFTAGEPGAMGTVTVYYSFSNGN